MVCVCVCVNHFSLYFLCESLSFVLPLIFTSMFTVRYSLSLHVCFDMRLVIGGCRDRTMHCIGGCTMHCNGGWGHALALHPRLQGPDLSFLSSLHVCFAAFPIPFHDSCSKIL